MKLAVIRIFTSNKFIFVSIYVAINVRCTC